MKEYMSWHNNAKKLCKRWTFNLFKNEYLGLEMGFLAGQKLLEMPQLGLKAREHLAALDSTRTSCVQLDAKLIRGGGKNNVVAVVALMSDYNYRRQTCVLTSIPEPLNVWTTTAIKGLRQLLHVRLLVVG